MKRSGGIPSLISFIALVVIPGGAASAQSLASATASATVVTPYGLEKQSDLELSGKQIPGISSNQGLRFSEKNKMPAGSNERGTDASCLIFGIPNSAYGLILPDAVVAYAAKRVILVRTFASNLAADGALSAKGLGGVRIGGSVSEVAANGYMPDDAAIGTLPITVVYN